MVVQQSFLEVPVVVPIEETSLSPFSLDDPPIGPPLLDPTPLPLNQFPDGEGCEEPSSMRETREMSENTQEKEECIPPTTLDPNPTYTSNLETTLETGCDEGNFEYGAIVFQDERPIALLTEKQLFSFATHVRTLEPHPCPTTQTDLIFPFVIRDDIHEASGSKKGLNLLMHDSIERYQKELKQRCSEFLENQQGESPSFTLKLLCSQFEHPLNRKSEMELIHLGDVLMNAYSLFPFDTGQEHDPISMTIKNHLGSCQWKIFDPGSRFILICSMLFSITCYQISPSLRSNSFKEGENDVELGPHDGDRPEIIPLAHPHDKLKPKEINEIRKLVQLCLNATWANLLQPKLYGVLSLAHISPN